MQSLSLLVKRAAQSKTVLPSPATGTGTKRASILKRSTSREMVQSQLRAKVARGGSRLSQGTLSQTGTNKALNLKQSSSQFFGQKTQAAGASGQPGASQQGRPSLGLPGASAATAKASKASKRGVKHVIANLDASVIERRPNSSCDTSMLNNTVNSLLRVQPRGLKEPTNFHSAKKELPSQKPTTDESMLRQKCQATARLVHLTLDESSHGFSASGAMTERNAKQAGRPAHVPGFSREAMRHVQSQRKLDQIVQKPPQ